MGLFSFLFKEKSNSSKEIVNDENPEQVNFIDERIKIFYEHPERLVDIEFSNRTNTLKNIWIEPACTSINLDHETEYRIVTHDKFFRMEFDNDNQVIFYLQYSFGFKLYKRLRSDEVVNKNEWIIDYDCSHIN